MYIIYVQIQYPSTCIEGPTTLDVQIKYNVALYSVCVCCVCVCDNSRAINQKCPKSNLFQTLKIQSQKSRYGISVCVKLYTLFTNLFHQNHCRIMALNHCKMIIIIEKGRLIVVTIQRTTNKKNTNVYQMHAMAHSYILDNHTANVILKSNFYLKKKV